MYVRGCEREVRGARGISPTARDREFGAREDRRTVHFLPKQMAPKKTIVKKTLPKAKASGSSGGLVKIEACKS